MRGIFIAAAVASLSPVPAFAWGYEGHEVVAAIAQSYLTPQAAANVDGLLAADTDTLTRRDMISRATWADAWRGAGHRETAQWHYVDLELDHPDLKSACNGEPAPDHPASAGPSQDCIVDRIIAFQRELSNPATPQPERILALKYLLHFIGDLHQPLHVSDNHDRGGNCVRVSLGGPRTTNLHSYWDTVVVEELDTSAKRLAARLRGQITPAQARQWATGNVRDWAMETYAVSKAFAYWPGAPSGCDYDAAPISLPTGYEARSRKVAAEQLERAGVRLAAVLNKALTSRRFVSEVATVPISVAPLVAAPAPPLSDLARLPHCRKGKPCGHSCIATYKVCHKQ